MKVPNRFEEGASAFIKWKESSTPDNEWEQGKNPYPENSAEYHEWDTGWEDAFQYHFRSFEVE